MGSMSDGASRSPLAVDARLGNYRVVRELGATAIGMLYAAEHVVLPRRALIKVATRAGSVPLLREACLLEALRHAGIPAVYESGLLADARPWFAFEAASGERISDENHRGPMRPLEVASLIRDVARVLEHAHRRGVVHAGLRPERIVLTSGRGYPLCVTEWSDARTHDAAPAIPHVPAPGARGYMAPEVVRGDAMDDRADIYALGVVAYQALTGQLPAEAYVPVGARCPRAPRELATAIDQMLARDRFDRPSSREVVADIGWVTDAGRTAGDTLTEMAAVTDVELVDMDGLPEAAPRTRQPRWTPYVVASVDAAGVVAGEIEDVSSSQR